MSKVWRKVVVMKTVELVIGIDEDDLSEDSLQSFSKYFHHVDDEKGIFDTVAFQYVNGGHQFAEGVGQVGGEFDKEEDFPVIVKETYEDTEVEVMEVL